MDRWKVGDRVFVTADNYGTPATIIEIRESTGALASRYKVRPDSGSEFWAFDYEVSNAEWEKKDAPYG